jgi:hypothetical protein
LLQNFSSHTISLFKKDSTFTHLLENIAQQLPPGDTFIGKRRAWYNVSGSSQEKRIGVKR